MKRAHKQAAQHGFSLIELMVTLAVAGILAGAAAPSFRDAVANSQQTTVYNSVVSAMRFARSEAIKQSAPVSVCAREANNADTCGDDWNEGWLIFSDGGATPGDLDDGEMLLRVGNKPTSNVRVTNRALLQNSAGSPIPRLFIRFGPRGTSNWRGSGSYVFCDGRGSDNAMAINVSLSGDVRRARRNESHQLLDAFGVQVTCP